jgi:hypothetical protein
MAEVPGVYRQVDILKEISAGLTKMSSDAVSIISYDEMPELQALLASRQICRRMPACDLRPRTRIYTPPTVSSPAGIDLSDRPSHMRQ